MKGFESGQIIFPFQIHFHIGITPCNWFLGILNNGPPVPSDRFQFLQLD